MNYSHQMGIESRISALEVLQNNTDQLNLILICDIFQYAETLRPLIQQNGKQLKSIERQRVLILDNYGEYERHEMSGETVVQHPRDGFVGRLSIINFIFKEYDDRDVDEQLQIRELHIVTWSLHLS